MTAETEGTVAVVLTHRRPRLATELVRSLIDVEGIPPARVMLVVDREGGLDDPSLERAVQVHRLQDQPGPAGGFRYGIQAAFADPSVKFAYLCEDDVTLLGLPTPRVSRLIDRLISHESETGVPIGAIVAYGRRFSRRPGVTDPFVPEGLGPELEPVDVAAWGATIVTRRVVEAQVLPDDHWFFAYEDFDFFLRLRKAGLAVLVDTESAIATAPATATSAGRSAALRGNRPDDGDEWWRTYYVSRNMFELARRHGNHRWILWHLAYSARRLQLARSGAERRAIVVGLLHGLTRRHGPSRRYLRSLGEQPLAQSSPSRDQADNDDHVEVR